MLRKQRGTLNKSMNLITVQKRHMVLFVLLSLFAVVQVVWWVIFQIQVTGRERAVYEMLWERQIETAQYHIEEQPQTPDSLHAWLNRSFPDLVLAENGSITVSDSVWFAVNDRIHNTRNMFFHEGIVLGLVLMAGIIYLYRTLRREVAIERRQANFLAAISHELKTPITALRLYLDTLIERDLAKPKREELQRAMGENLTRLQALIEQLLQARAMIGMEESRNLEVIDAVVATGDVIRHFEEVRHDSARIVINYTPPSEPLRIRFDPEQWRQVLLNLLDNAVKYSEEEAKIEVKLHTRRRKMLLSVRDHGIGFNPAERKRIFHRFYRIGNEDTRRTGGSGIGLYLVREIVHHHRGKVAACSVGEGKGATFIVEVPLVREK